MDPRVWPSLFAGRETGWTGPNAGLWDDLARMREALGASSPAHEVLAVGWVSADGFTTSAEGWGPYREPVSPATEDETWTLLGFDVADAGFTSGLSNCGYTPEERRELRTPWREALNTHHLFTEVERALAFKTLTDQRVPEHAPFFVYALWSLPHDG